MEKKMRVLTCEDCGVQWERERKTGRPPTRCVTCQGESKAERHRAASKRWAAKHPERKALYMRAYLEANREAIYARRRQRHKENPHYAQYQLAYDLRRLYGITVEDYEALRARQGDRCALCDTADPGRMRWHVDHDHVTGQVRGLLCSSCNTGIGHLKDDPELLEAAAAYVREHRQLRLIA